MKTVVFAYHDMGCLGIEALLSAGYEISAIFTHTDNPGEKAFYGSVARLAAERGIPVYAPDNVNHPLWVERIAQLSPEVIFSFYYRHLICDEILQLAPRGAFNLHGSLLPKYQTALPHIYAVGDVIGYPSLASAAYDQGRIAAQALIKGEASAHLIEDIPTGIYTIPEISSVGKTEQQLTAMKVPYEVGRAQFKHLARAQIVGMSVGTLKILFHRETKEILGIH